MSAAPDMWGRKPRHIQEARAARLWQRYWAIDQDHKPGLSTPILWHLALRGDAGAMATLGDFLGMPGGFSVAYSKAGLARRAYRLGYAYGAQHLAMDAFNRRDLGGYRYWLRRAANAGDPDSAQELKRFETRLPHINARKIGRKRPHRSYD